MHKIIFREKIQDNFTPPQQSWRQEKTMKDNSKEVEGWRLGPLREIASNTLFRGVTSTVRNPRTGIEKDFYRFELPPWVNILAFTPGQKILLVRQFRFGTEQMEWEVPGGVVEKGESPLDAGLRELKEETGFAGENGRIIGTIHPNSAIQNNILSTVLVENAAKVAAPELDPMEDIEVRQATLPEVMQMLREGKLRHGFTYNALMHYFLFKDKISY